MAIAGATAPPGEVMKIGSFFAERFKNATELRRRVLGDLALR
jgi:hypothetical protein